MLLLVPASLWAQAPQTSVDVQNSTFKVMGGMARRAMDKPDWHELPVLRGHNGDILAVSLSADGKRALTGGADGTARIWDMETGTELHLLDGHGGRRVYGVSLNKDGRFALTGGRDGTAQFWSAENDWESPRILRGHKRGRKGHAVLSVSLSADGDYALTTGMDGMARMWDTRTGEELKTLSGHKRDDGYRLAFGALNADGNLALTGGVDGRGWVWDANRGGRLLQELLGHESDEFGAKSIRSVSLSADGKRALTGGVDGTARIWDTETGEQLSVLQGHEVNEDGVNEILDVALSADGSVALTGGTDGTARIWNANAGGEEIQVLRVHGGPVSGVSLSADGKRALTGSEDGTARAWIDLRVFIDQTSQAYQEKVMNQKINDYIRQAKVPYIEGISEVIPDPVYLEPKTFEKDPLENEAAFIKRTDEAKAVHDQQNRDIEAEYQAQVEARSKKIEEYTEIEWPRIRLEAYARAVAEVYGRPMLEARWDDDGNEKYESEEEFLYVGLRYEHREKLEDWIFEVPAGDAVTEFFKALERGEVTATAEYSLKEDGIVDPVAVHAQYRSRQYIGKHSEGREHRPLNVTRVVGIGDFTSNILQEDLDKLDDDKKDQIIRVDDTAALFDDNIAALYNAVEAAEPDQSKWLFVIGIEDYDATPDVKYSERSAKGFAEAAAKVLGVIPAKQTVLIDNKATGLAIERELDDMLESVLDGDHIYFYYSGHGMASRSAGNPAYIVPSDADPFQATTHEKFRLDNIFLKLGRSKASLVIAFMDSCFNNITDSQSVFGDTVGSAVLVSDSYEPPKNGNLAVLMAGREDQYSNGHPDKRHRIFSYFLIKELLSGHATINELAKAVSDSVKKETINLGGGDLRQDPVLRGNRELDL